MAAQGLLDIPMKLPPQDESSGLPPGGFPPAGSPPGGGLPPDDGAGLPPPGGKEIQAPPSQLSGGTWERLSPGQFMYHPSEEDLALPDLPGHFAEIEVVGDLLMMPNGDIYEGGIAHDMDDDGTPDQPTHFGKPDGETPTGAPPMGEPDGDEPPAGDNIAAAESKLGVPPGNSWENKPGPSTLPLKTKKNY